MSRKKIIAIAVTAAVLIALFLCYPLIICVINKVGIIKERNKITDKLEAAGCEVYSSKTSSEAVYGDVYIHYLTDCQIVFRSDMSLDELSETFHNGWWIVELDWADNCFTYSDMVDTLEKPDDPEGYYALATTYIKAYIQETGGTPVHRYLYAE